MAEHPNDQNRPPNGNVMAGGAPLALLTIAGPIVAAVLGYSPSIGFLVGLGLGIIVAVVIWLAGRG